MSASSSTNNTRMLELRGGLGAIPGVRLAGVHAGRKARNRDLALERLAARLAAALKTRKQRRATKPSKGAVERRLQEKRRQAQRKAGRRRPVDD